MDEIDLPELVKVYGAVGAQELLLEHVAAIWSAPEAGLAMDFYNCIEHLSWAFQEKES